MKDKIMQTSIQLFGKKGFTETSVQDIVNEIGVTKGTFYYYFTSKDELLAMIHYEFINNILDKQEEVLNNPNIDSKEKLDQIVKVLTYEIKHSAQSARIFFREMRHISEEHLAKISPKRHQFRKNLEKLVTDGMANGEFQEHVRPDILSYAILGITNWSYFWYDPSGPIKEKELAEGYVEFILKGLLK
ncbi:TetR/AcrR family transcriptional regulator [Piscibacillus halophilus]|uniref:Transcriptional regulator, TetR family n=1 Tax=Piscibacillus halophilus TaxID=571933 RepID=A0A1H9HH71_9BACI|nr:TetR/AcrR family transcriptional regulator [Piscibacillus halophilus]SEQ61689.1 transcriptional regulator, TetR family [Piscibacillus halophilus]